jgi:hypothetical protein
LDTSFFVHKRIISAFKGDEFVSDRMSYIILRGHSREDIFKPTIENERLFEISNNRELQ